MSPKRRPPRKPVIDWHKADVIAALHKRGTSLRKLAISRGLNPRTLTKALRLPYPKAEALIAAAVGISPIRIWPSRYDPRQPVGARRLAHLNASRPRAARNVESIDKALP